MMEGDEKMDNEYIVFKIEGDGFLRFMVRNIVGTLVDVGLAKKTPRDFNKILASKDRNLAGMTAPAHGLCLSHPDVRAVPGRGAGDRRVQRCCQSPSSEGEDHGTGDLPGGAALPLSRCLPGLRDSQRYRRPEPGVHQYRQVPFRQRVPQSGEDRAGFGGRPAGHGPHVQGLPGPRASGGHPEIPGRQGEDSHRDSFADVRLDPATDGSRSGNHRNSR